MPALAKVDLKPVKYAEVTCILRKNDNDKENDVLINDDLKGESKAIKVNLKQTVKELKKQIR